MKAAFIINARNKAGFVARAVKGALAQTYPCEILISDQASTDGTFEEILRTVNDTKEMGAAHTVKVLRCPVEGAYGMRACNQHIAWLVEQTEAPWVFQCSADDYSLPERVRKCMDALDRLHRNGRDCSGIACTMRFEAPGKPENGATSGYPTESGYVSAGVGLMKLAYGSTIWGYRREFLQKVGLDVPCTLDVYLGYLAALDRGYYVVADPQHVHYMAEDMSNMGFQGKMRAAEASGDKETIARINELNRFQLFELYCLTKMRQQALYPLAHQEDQNALLNMILSQACGWYVERANLHAQKITPGVL